MVSKFLGKLIQRSNLGICRAIEFFMLHDEGETIRTPILAIAGPPRSGTTLTYQLLTQGLDVWFINNLHYLFYRTPILGYKLARKLAGPYVSDYKSRHGFVRGINGPAEANLFWQYWCDLNLKEKMPQTLPKRLRKSDSGTVLLPFRSILPAL